VSTKGFSLIELLVVIAILGIITSTGFLFLKDSVRDSRIQNEFTHTLQLIKKYAKQSLTSQEPILINFSYTSSDTIASIYTMNENDFSRFHKTDCTGIDPTNSEKYFQISETNNTFSNVSIKACDGSDNINICFTGRGGFVDSFPDNDSKPTVYILPYQDHDCTFLASGNEIPHQRHITLYTSGYIDDPSR